MARQSKKRSKQRSEKLRIRKIAAKKAKKAGKTSSSTTSKPRLKANRQKKALAQIFTASSDNPNPHDGLVTSIYNVATKLSEKDGYDWLSMARHYIEQEGDNAGKEWRTGYFSHAKGYDDKTATEWTTDVPTGEAVLREWRINLESRNK